MTPNFLETLEEGGVRIFTRNDAEKILNKPRKYVNLFLHRLYKNKKIGRIERSKYYVMPSSTLEIATGIVRPSYASLLSAFEYYDITNQIPILIEVISPKQHDRLEINGTTIKFIKTSARRLFGYYFDRKTRASIAEIEKSIIDALYFNNPQYGYVEEAFAKALRRIDIKKLKDYGIKMKCKTLINKLGFLLESQGIKTDDLLKFKSKNRVFVSKGKKFNKKWGVVYG